MSTRPTRRRNARLGTGVLALALLAPAAEPAIAGATDPGEEQESELEGGQEAGPEEDAGDLTPGQGATEDPIEENTPALVAPGDNSDANEGANEDGPVEVAPPPEEDDAEQPAAAPVTPPPAAPAPPPVAAIPPPAVEPDRTVAEAPPAPRTRVPPVRRNGKSRRRDRPDRPKRGEDRQPLAARPAPVPRTPAVLEPGPAPAPRAGTTRQAQPAPVRAANGPTHTVRSGDTLWAIAAAQLGSGATPAQIAREVQRLWDLNARAIGTGDPSLLGVGVELRLR